MPSSVTSQKSTAAFCHTKVPDNTAARANRNTTRLEASLTRLSPSRILMTRLGTLIPFNTAVAATASGGEIMPPSRKPNASVNPGMTALEM
jgi:hypothetical protein